ncbi:hypothetical protein J6590_052761, partial [Homalodisca vitripennis]
NIYSQLWPPRANTWLTRQQFCTQHTASIVTILVASRQTDTCTFCLYCNRAHG